MVSFCGVNYIEKEREICCHIYSCKRDGLRYLSNMYMKEQKVAMSGIL